MPFNIPYSFQAGTKAKANEVNENFLAVKQFVDILEDNEATNEINIADLQNNKANINGNPEQRFQCSDATASHDAVNLGTLIEYVDNTREVIRGFELSLFNTTTIQATAGSCYDSTFEYMILSNVNLTVETSSLAADTTYYVYVCADKDTKTNQLVYSTNNTTPSLPVGYEYYRRIGTFVTDDDGAISGVYSGNESPDSRNGVSYIGANIGTASTTTLTENRWLKIKIQSWGDEVGVTIDGTEVAYIKNTKDWAFINTQLIPCKKGQTVTITKRGGGQATWLEMV